MALKKRGQIEKKLITAISVIVLLLLAVLTFRIFIKEEKISGTYNIEKVGEKYNIDIALEEDDVNKVIEIKEEDGGYIPKKTTQGIGITNLFKGHPKSGIQIQGAETPYFKFKIIDYDGQGITTQVLVVEELNIEKATITLAKKSGVGKIMHCENFEINASTCTSWAETDIPFIDNGDTITFEVTHFTGYGGAGLNTNLTIFDDTNDLEGENDAHFVNEQIGFYANYTNATRSPVNGTGINCTIKFNLGAGWQDIVNMTFNVTSGLYEYDRNFSTKGEYDYHVLCNDSSAAYNASQATDDFVVYHLRDCPDCPMVCSSSGGIVTCPLNNSFIEDAYYTSFYNRMYDTPVQFAGVAWSGSSNPAEWWSPPHFRYLYIRLKDIDEFPDDLEGFTLNLTTYSRGIYHLYWNSSSPTYGLTLGIINTSWKETDRRPPVSTAMYSRGDKFKDYSFKITGTGWIAVNITDLYNGWKNGTYVNYGVVLIPPSNKYTSCYARDCSNSIYSSEYPTTPPPVITFGSPARIIVNKTSPPCMTGTYFPTIQEGIDFANTTLHDIYICPGTYESFVVNKTVNLHPFNDQVYVNSSSPAATITVDGITLKGFNFIPSSGDMAIRINSSSNSILNNDITSSNAIGIYLNATTSNNIIKNNIINTTGNNAHGIFLNNSGNNTISYNILDTDYSYAIYIKNSTNDIFSFNFIEGINTSFTYSGDLGIKGVITRPALPPKYNDINRYLNITNFTAAWMYLNISYEDADAINVSETTVRFFRYHNTWSNSTSIFPINNINISDNIVYANITNFSIFAPLAGYIDNPPIVSLDYPPDGYSFYNSSMLLDFNCSAIDGDNLTNITLYHNLNGSWESNGTVSISGQSNSTSWTINMTYLPVGTYKWNCLAYDNASQSDWGDQNYTLTKRPSPYITSCVNINDNGTYNLTNSIMDSNIDCCINISANEVTFLGLGNMVDGDGTANSGICIIRDSDVDSFVDIKNVTVKDWATNGIYIYRASDNYMAYVNASNNGKHGINITGNGPTQYNQIEHSYINNNGKDGIYVYKGETCIIQYNELHNNAAYGIYLGSNINNNCTIEYNEISNSNISIYVDGGNYISVSYNNMTNSTIGIQYNDPDNINMYYNRIINISSDGIFTSSTPEYADIYNSYINNIGKYGITGTYKFARVKNNIISNDTGSDSNYYAIGNSGSSLNNTIINNTIINYQSGIDVQGYQHNITNNTMKNLTGHFGIQIQWYGHEIKNNIIYGSPRYGFNMSNAYNTLIKNNWINGSVRWAMYLIGTTIRFNTFYNNNLTNNIKDFFIRNDNESDVLNWNQTANKTYLSSGKLLYYNHSVSNVVYDAAIANIGFFGCYDCSGVTIKNMYAANNSHAVILANSRNMKVENITFNDLIHPSLATGDRAYERGIHLSHTNNTLITNSNGSSTYGVYLYQSSYNNLTNSIIGTTTYASQLYAVFLNQYSNYNLISNNQITTYSATSNRGVYLYRSSNNTIESNTIIVSTNNATGIYLADSDNNTYENNQINDSSISTAIHIDYDAVNNLFKTNLIRNVNHSFDYGLSGIGYLELRGVDSPKPDPANYTNITKYVNITNTTAAWVYLNISYLDSDLTNIKDESTLGIWRYNGTGWSNNTGTATRGVSTALNFVYANITLFSDFGPFGQGNTPTNLTPYHTFIAYTGDCSDDVIFCANYTNVTGDFIPGANCNITFGDIAGVYDMPENATVHNYCYTRTTDWAASGTYTYTVNCSKQDYYFASENNSITFTQCLAVGQVIPEFNLIGIFLILIIAAVGYVIVSSKEIKTRKRK